MKKSTSITLDDKDIQDVNEAGDKISYSLSFSQKLEHLIRTHHLIVKLRKGKNKKPSTNKKS